MRIHNQTNRPTDQQTNCLPLFSIIVPVYNCEKYITQCLDSLINQDYPEKNYEIIITDDGSTDNSGNICDEYAAKFPFIHVTHTENYDTARARNTALKQCKGEYITFCDADDVVSPYMISLLTKAIKFYEKPDMLVWKFFRKEPKYGWPKYETDMLGSYNNIFYEPEDVCIKIITDQNVGGFLWNKAIKYTLANKIYFDETLHVMEDRLWLLSVLIAHKNAKINYVNLDCYLYFYIQHPNFGLTRQTDRAYRKQDGMSWYILCMEKELEISSDYPCLIEQIKGSIYASVAGALYSNHIKFSDEVRRKMKSYLKQYAFGYYFRSKHTPISKLKTFIKRILSLLHIYKHKKITLQPSHRVQ